MSKHYERIKALYNEERITIAAVRVYVAKGLLTIAEYGLITGEPYASAV